MDLVRGEALLRCDSYDPTTICLLASHWLEKFDNVISIISSYNSLLQTEFLVLFCLYFKQAFNSCYYRTWEVQEQGTGRFKSWQGPIWFAGNAFSLRPQMGMDSWERTNKVFPISPYKETIPSTKIPPPWLQPPNAVPLGVYVSIYEFTS